MRSIPFPLRLLAILPLALTLEACPHPSTPSSLARTDRPTLPTRNPELTKTERLAPIAHPETGVQVSVDAGWLKAIQDLLAQAIGAVTRANNRAAGNKQADRCTRAVFETGKLPADCPADPK